MIQKFLLPFFIFLLSVVIFLTWEGQRTTTYQGEIMGTTYKVIMIDGNQKEADIFKILNSVNNEMSTYIESSTISILNKSEIGKWVNVSNNFIKVASFSKKICDETNGAFNIGLGHFVNYYGFTLLVY